MKRLLRLPLSFVKVMIALVMLSIGMIIILCIMILYFDYKSLFTKKKHETAET
ncbi:MAG: hypothetical protein WC455_04445 [Dehalococcoidia bacterium]|jgi:Tfp pilus assembly protein PilW